MGSAIGENLNYRASQLKPLSPPKPSNSGKSFCPGNIGKSLNQESRKKELLRITMDNISLMHRINSMKSFYNQNDWKEHNYNHHKYLKLHCEFPM